MQTIFSTVEKVLSLLFLFPPCIHSHVAYTHRHINIDLQYNTYIRNCIYMTVLGLSTIFCHVTQKIWSHFQKIFKPQYCCIAGEAWEDKGVKGRWQLWLNAKGVYLCFYVLSLLIFHPSHTVFFCHRGVIFVRQKAG